jgi:methylated-DNA-[protein]-cysteine S-methyltransferase
MRPHRADRDLDEVDGPPEDLAGRDPEELASRDPGAGHAGWLEATLAERAEVEGLLDVAYRTLDTPIGTLILAATAAGLLRVAFEREGLDDVLRTLADRVSPRILEAPRRLDGAAGQIEEYFARRRFAFDLPVDLRLAGGFRRAVLVYLPRIGYGTTVSYRSVATALSHPRAVRAVGGACAANPIPVVVPCHRVVRADGGLGGYRGGNEVKQRLLELEAGG